MASGARWWTVPRETRADLRRVSDRLGGMAALTSRQETALERFSAAVEQSPHNLVSRHALSELRTRHVPESVAFAQRLPAGPARLLDLGAGGGFPGLVVAIVRPDLQVELLDATRKKVDFLRQVADDLQLDVAVHNGRAEDLGKGPLAGEFDHVTARAVAALDRLLALAFPFLRPGGCLHAIKGERWPEELADAAPALRRLGGTVVSTPETSGPSRDPRMPRVVSIARSERGK